MYTLVSWELLQYLVAFIVFIGLVWKSRRIRYLTIQVKKLFLLILKYIHARFLKDEVMSVIYSKVKMLNNIFEACKLVRNFISIQLVR